MGDMQSPAWTSSAVEMRPVLLRLQHSGALSPASVRRLEAPGGRPEAAPARTVIQIEGAVVRRPRWLLAGWACRHRLLPDGRRQVFDFILPGEGVGVCLRPHPLSQTGVVALTPVRLADAAPLLEPAVLADHPDLTLALQAQADLAEGRSLDQIVRLGQMSALERLAHLLLDLHDRLSVVQLVQGDRFELPLTQETLADAAGLSVVHVNRILQELRRQNLLEVGRGAARIPDLKMLRQAAAPEAPRV